MKCTTCQKQLSVCYILLKESSPPLYRVSTINLHILQTTDTHGLNTFVQDECGSCSYLTLQCLHKPRALYYCRSWISYIPPGVRMGINQRCSVILDKHYSIVRLIMKAFGSATYTNYPLKHWVNLKTPSYAGLIHLLNTYCANTI